jgi:hypothetical protein
MQDVWLTFVRMLTWALQKWYVRPWTTSAWFEVDAIVQYCEYTDEKLGFIRGGNSQ